jgi:endonuclease/exonuclease/phosphatase family metal-dependent hydrolase
MPRNFLLSAPGPLGALFCSLFLFAATSCERDGSTPEWETYGTPSGTVEREAGSETAPTPAPIQVGSAPENSSETTTAPDGGFRFISYNVKNWLTMERYVDGKLEDVGTQKPDKEKAAVITLLTNHLPDVIGLSEIGTEEDLRNIQSMLKATGVDLPYYHYGGGIDPVRHLGLLSKFPISSTSSPKVTEYRLEGKTYGIQRGILDATLKVGGKPYRFLGVHLKSKRESEDADQEAMRVEEARLLRRHVDDILEDDPNSRVIVYGDFNDTRQSTTVKTITGSAAGALTALYARDSRGDSWTHFWSFEDIYSRIDWIMVTPAMKPDVDFRESKVIDDKIWKDASDHRPILAIFR